jgi:hypothetical protein
MMSSAKSEVVASLRHAQDKQRMAPNVFWNFVASICDKPQREVLRTLRQDGLIGYITRAHGITFHRRDYPIMQRVPEDREDRLLEAKWAI